MGIETTVKVTCDYPGCKNNASKTGPAVVSWVKEMVESGQAPMPEEAKYAVLFPYLGATRTFCGQLHAAAFFLPPGFSIQRNQMIPFPGEVAEPEPEKPCACGHPWSEHNTDVGCTALKSPAEFCDCNEKGPKKAQ